MVGEYVNEVRAPKDQPLRPSSVVYPVIVRLALPDGSEQWRPGRTIKWTNEAVYVAWETTPGEPRHLSRAWLAVEDVRRVIRRPRNDDGVG